MNDHTGAGQRPTTAPLQPGTYQLAAHGAWLGKGLDQHKLTKVIDQDRPPTATVNCSTTPTSLGATDRPNDEQSNPLADIQALLRQHHQQEPAIVGRAVRDEAAARMRSLARTRRHPVAVDLRLDAHVVLPDAVAREAERAALLLARLTPHPYDTPALGDYLRRFYQRFGAGAQVPLLEVVADSGLGWPAGYPGASARPQRPARTRRARRCWPWPRAPGWTGARRSCWTRR